MADEQDATPAEREAGIDSTVGRWVAELDSYDRAFETWKEDVGRISKRYALEQSRSGGQASIHAAPEYNILWSNVQTIQPSIFSQEPIPVVQRRHRDPDPIGRLAAQTLERALISEMEMDGWDDVFDQMTLDVLLGARGVVWVRYEPTITKIKEWEHEADFSGGGVPKMVEREVVSDERAPIDYIYWKDFAHSPKKTWPEVVARGWVARRVYMTCDEVVKRFGDEFKDIPIDFKSSSGGDQTSEKIKQVLGTAEVWEIWDAVGKQTVWLCKQYTDKLLDRKPDPLGLQGFFPCPMPAYGSRSNESLAPIPDYLQYEPLAEELDDVTRRISELIPAVRAAGVYDARIPGLGRLFTDSAGQNDLVAVDNLSAFLTSGSSGGTIAGVLQMLPLDTIASALGSLYEIRSQISNTIYEISGVSDIVRGSVDPREKLGQSQLKGQYASQRLSKRQRKVENCARDTIRIKAEIMAERYSDKMLRSLSGFDLLPEVIRAQEEASQPSPDGAPGTPPEVVADQMWQQAVALLRDDKARGFRIDVETKSTIFLNEQEEREGRMEFLRVAGQFVERAGETVQMIPEMAPLMTDMLLFTVRSFRPGRSIEGSFEDFADQVRDAARQPPPPPEPDPAAEAEQAKMQAEVQKAQIGAQSAQQKAALDAQKGQQKMAADGQKAQIQIQTEQAKAQSATAQAETSAALSQVEMQVKLEEMQAEFSVKLGELAAKVDAAEQMAEIKTKSALDTAAAKKATD